MGALSNLKARAPLLVLLALSSLVWVAAQGISKTFELLQDDLDGRYFLEMFVGSKLERVNLLIDTQANGTAISYSYLRSKRMKLSEDRRERTVEVPSFQGFKFEFGGAKVPKPFLIHGSLITDFVCLDKREDTCLMDFDFINAVNLDPREIGGAVAMHGVLPFNRYQYGEDPRMQLVHDLMEEDEIFYTEA